MPKHTLLSITVVSCFWMSASIRPGARHKNPQRIVRWPVSTVGSLSIDFSTAWHILNFWTAVFYYLAPERAIAIEKDQKTLSKSKSDILLHPCLTKGHMNAIKYYVPHQCYCLCVSVSVCVHVCVLLSNMLVFVLFFFLLDTPCL